MRRSERSDSGKMRHDSRRHCDPFQTLFDFQRSIGNLDDSIICSLTQSENLKR